MKYNNNNLEVKLKSEILALLPEELTFEDSSQLFQMDEKSYKVGFNSALVEIKTRLGLYDYNLNHTETENVFENSASLSTLIKQEIL
jgi:hypothetical protein